MTLYSNTDKTGAFKPKHFGLFIAAQILILAVAIAAGYWFYGKFQESNEVAQKVEPVVVVADPSVATVLGRSDIAWEKKPVKIENLGFFTDVKEDWVLLEEKAIEAFDKEHGDLTMAESIKELDK